MSTKLLLKLEGTPDSRALATYQAHGGYAAAKKALSMTPEAIIDEVKQSGLRGRGGAGFATGVKWSFVPKNMPGPKYLICNNDESEPGTFKDRYLCTVTPHSVIEGMIIAAYAIGANKGYIYTRWEFQQEIAYLEQAIKEAYAAGLLGKNLFGTNFSFDLDHYTGAGAYICGEETGLISSLEGKKGNPKLKPPFPAISGYLERPTIVNNTETLAAVPWIINNGAAAYRQHGTEKSAGTKLFSISGALKRPGVYEVPLGYPLMKLINEDCGGMLPGRSIKGCIPGGASAPILTPAEMEKCTLDYECMAQLGTMLGSGAIMVVDDRANMIDLLRDTIEFFAHESCGQCTPCREGTGWLSNIMQGIAEKTVSKDSVDRLSAIARNMGGKTICALSDACAMPVMAFVKKYGDEFRAYIEQGGKAQPSSQQQRGH